MKQVLTAEQVGEMSVEEINEVIHREMAYDDYKWQKENNIKITEDFRADGLNKVLYKCPHCMAEGQTVGKGVMLTCKNCGAEYTLDEYGYLTADKPAFTHIPDWYAWQRQMVREELEKGTYKLETDVDIAMLVDTKALYMVGEGKLIHDENGFRLTGCDGKLDYSQGPLSCYGLYSDYYWYEIGDVICIGNKDALYYCFPKDNTPVAKTRLATEELYKLKKRKKAPATL